MSPRIEDSVKELPDGGWAVGSMGLYKYARDEAPTPGALVCWTVGENDVYALYDQKSPCSQASAVAETHRIHLAGTSAATWRLGQIIIKVKAWQKDMELEADTIALVISKCPSVPVPQVLYNWVDTEWNRSFLIMKAIAGKDLNKMWPLLDHKGHTAIAETIAGYCKELARQKSDEIKSGTGRGVMEHFLSPEIPDDEPSWKPYLLGPQLPEPLQRHLKEQPKMDYSFAHCDLGPTNIIISEDGSQVNGVIDWESAGYYPDFWIATKPCVSAAFLLEGVGSTNTQDWRGCLTTALEKSGFQCDKRRFEAWQRACRVKEQ